jgi:hypothetical protein
MKWLMREQFSFVEVILLMWITSGINDENYLFAAIIFCVFMVLAVFTGLSKRKAARGE